MTEIAQVAHAGGTVVRPCPSCQREWGQGVVCQACKQVEGLPIGVRLSSPGRRLGEYALDVLLFFVTLGIGWFVWTLVILGRGQTPAKQILNMRTIHLEDGEITSWGRNALREFIAKPIISFAAWFTFGILYLWLLWDKNNQELWDKMMDTVVVTDPYDKLKPVPLPPPQGRETAALPSSSAAPENPTFAPPQAPTHTEAPVQAEPAQDATPPETDQG